MASKVILASTKQSVFTEPSWRYLRHLGYKVEFFDIWNKAIWNNDMLVRLTNQFSKFKMSLVVKAEKNIGRKLIKVIKDAQPDYLLVLKGKPLSSEVICQISALGVKTINWFPDATTNWHSIEILSAAYDYFFTYDPYILKRLKALGRNNCYYLPFAANLDTSAVYQPRSEYKYDIVFIGSYEPGLYDARVDYLSVLTDLDLHIWGNQNWLKTSLAKFYRGTVDDQKMFNIYRQSKIVVNIDQQIEVEEGLNLRPFEVTAAGSFLLNDPVKDDIYRLFTDGEEVVVFNGVQDLRKKAEYYLSHEKEREKIAQAGFNRSLAEHTYSDRLKQMFKIADK